MRQLVSTGVIEMAQDQKTGKSDSDKQRDKDVRSGGKDDASKSKTNDKKSSGGAGSGSKSDAGKSSGGKSKSR